MQGLPLLKPPYRRITAIDVNRGEHAWQKPIGQGPTHHPAIKHLNLGPLGSQHPSHAAAEGGILLTKTLLITFLAKVDELEEWAKRYPDGGYLQAYDKATGELLAKVEVDRSLHSAPMTYMHDGRQYIVIAGGGSRGAQPDEPAELIAFALPL